MANLDTVSATWLETLGSVAVGALLAGVPSYLAITAENRRFEALNAAQYESEEAEQLRRCLAVMVHSIAVCRELAEELAKEPSKQSTDMATYLMGMIDKANQEFYSRIGEIYTNQRATPFHEKYKEIMREFNAFLVHGNQPGSNKRKEAREMVSRLEARLNAFSSDAKEVIERLKQPASVRIRIRKKSYR